MIYSGTGHRPGKNFDYSQETFNNLVELCDLFINEYKPNKIISGMALGFDQALAQAAINQNIPLISAIPCANQEKQWPPRSQKLYRNLMQKASEVHVLSEEYTKSCMQERNVWMVDNSDAVVALYDGSAGGTGNCIKYALSKKKEIVNLWTIWKQNY